MQELEKILEEIEEHKHIVEIFGREVYFVPLTAVEQIIRKHMTDDSDGWVPVKKRLPENAKHKGAFCPKYQVNTKFGVTEGWYNPDVESWYLLIWFMTERYLEQEIDFKRGDVPKIVRVPKECNIVFAWREKPKSYQPERIEEHA